MESGNHIPNDNKIRCPWCLSFDDYIQYHDEEWGVPVHDDNKHFEFLILEGAQAGLSWATVLKKRNGYKDAFANFDPQVVSQFPVEKIEELMLNSGIIRNRLKITSVINNARLFLQIQKEFGSFDKYIWGFVNHETVKNSLQSMSDAKATSKESDALSKDLIKRGFKFTGSTVMYAYMQACGLVNDHLVNCNRYDQV